MSQLMKRWSFRTQRYIPNPKANNEEKLVRKIYENKSNHQVGRTNEAGGTGVYAVV